MGTSQPGRGKVYGSITETIGDTPLVSMNRLAKERGIKANLLAKLEFFNPIGSVKDRIGVNMIDALEAAGKIEPGRTILVEPTSGQYGHRARLRRRSKGLQAQACDAGFDVARTAQDARASGRRTCAHARRAGHEGGHSQGSGDRRRDAGSDHSAAVREPGQPRNPSPHDRRGDLERYGRAGRRLCLGRGHRRHDHRRRAGAESQAARD